MNKARRWLQSAGGAIGRIRQASRRSIDAASNRARNAIDYTVRAVRNGAEATLATWKRAEARIWRAAARIRRLVYASNAASLARLAAVSIEPGLLGVIILVGTLAVDTLVPEAIAPRTDQPADWAIGALAALIGFMAVTTLAVSISHGIVASAMEHYYDADVLDFLVADEERDALVALIVLTFIVSLGALLEIGGGVRPLIGLPVPLILATATVASLAGFLVDRSRLFRSPAIAERLAKRYRASFPDPDDQRDGAASKVPLQMARALRGLARQAAQRRRWDELRLHSDLMVDLARETDPGIAAHAVAAARPGDTVVDPRLGYLAVLLGAVADARYAAAPWDDDLPHEAAERRKVSDRLQRSLAIHARDGGDFMTLVTAVSRSDARDALLLDLVDHLCNRPNVGGLELSTASVIVENARKRETTPGLKGRVDEVSERLAMVSETAGKPLTARALRHVPAPLLEERTRVSHLRSRRATATPQR